MLGDHLRANRILDARQLESRQAEAIALAQEVSVHIELAQVFQDHPHHLLRAKPGGAHKSAFAALVSYGKVALFMNLR